MCGNVTHIRRAWRAVLWRRSTRSRPAELTAKKTPSEKNVSGNRPDAARLRAFAQAEMVMTEKQGGSDLRANSTIAEPIGDGWFELTGHKWFCTHPVFDVFFTLAQTEAGITCFVAQRPHPGFRIQRLKDKLGGRCLASEVEYDHLPARSSARRVADGRIIEQLTGRGWTR